MCEQGIVAGYGSGHLRIFDRESGTLKVQVAAHAKWINAIDVTEDGEMVSVLLKRATSICGNCERW